MTDALTWARLAYRQQRWELLLVVLGVAGVEAGVVLRDSVVTGIIGLAALAATAAVVSRQLPVLEAGA